MKNQMSTSGIGEDMIRTIMSLAASEMHLKTLYEKTMAELGNGLIDTSNTELVQAHIQKAVDYKDDVIEIANLRRLTMKFLFDMFDGDKDMWCMVKHLAVADETAHESWLASDDNPDLLQLSVDINKAFVKALTRFLGTEITSCASCFSDMLKGSEDKDGSVEK